MKRFGALGILVVALGLLSGCATRDIYASDAEVARRSYSDTESPAHIVYFTMLRKSTQSGGHAGLLISGSEAVIYDPAGSFKHAAMPERADLLFGASPARIGTYVNFNVRDNYDTVVQYIEVPRAVADLAIARAKAQGSSAPAFCTQNITEILSGVPGFEDIPRTFFPTRVMEWMETRPGVETQKYTQEDHVGRRYDLYADNVLIVPVQPGMNN